MSPRPSSQDVGNIKVWGGWSGREDLNLRPPAPKAGALARLRHAPYVRIHTTFLLSLHNYHKSRKDSNNRLFPLCFQWGRNLVPPAVPRRVADEMRMRASISAVASRPSRRVYFFCSWTKPFRTLRNFFIASARWLILFFNSGSISAMVI